MKGMLANRMLKQAAYRTSGKKFSKSIYRRRLRKQLTSTFAESETSIGYLKPVKQGETNGLSVPIDCKDMRASIHESASQEETQATSVLNKFVIKDASQLAKDEVVPKGPIISPEWQAVVKSIIAGSEGTRTEALSPPIILVCGRKNSGKSTFARFLVNSLFTRYSKVGFLDTDVGQPELTPSGCLSLHMLDKPISGVPTLEMRSPERCFFYGDISPKGDPESYLSNIFGLYDYHQHGYNRILFPLVINTHGWVEGVGFDVLVEILRYTAPTHVVQILVRSSSQNLPCNRFWDSPCNGTTKAELLFVNSVVEGNSQLAEIKFNARELRDLRVVSYFQNCLKVYLMHTPKLPDLYREAAISLASCKPYQVPIAAIKVIHLHYQVPPFESPYTLNASLVGLGISSTSENCGKLSMKAQSCCIGLGLVRGVDILKGLFYVITPLPLEKLQQVDTFLHGNIQVPVPLLKAPNYVSPYLCKNAIYIEGTGAAAMGSGKKKFLRP